MTTSEDVLSMFGLHLGDMVLSKGNSMLLYKNDNAPPYGEIIFENGNFLIRCGFSILNTNRTSMIKRNSRGISVTPITLIYNNY